ncbi:MAG TPA: hypothetical protein VGN13_11320 [Solirubrobacteraceae bacterium]|jgi:hypothetical protein
MSADASGGPGAGGGAGEPSEEELRAAYEAELGRITATDMMAQAAVSLLNIGARRLGLAGEGEPAGASAAGRDLEQVRDAIDGARALLEILGRRIPQELGPLRDALSRLQMAYAREMQPGAGEPGAAPRAAGEQRTPDPGAEPPSAAREGDAGQGGGGEPRPGPAESSGRLWVPGR